MYYMHMEANDVLKIFKNIPFLTICQTSTHTHTHTQTHTQHTHIDKILKHMLMY